MNKLNIPGVQEITGADIYGGEAVAIPQALAIALTMAAIGYVVEKWPEMKQGFLDGYAGR